MALTTDVKNFNGFGTHAIEVEGVDGLNAAFLDMRALSGKLANGSVSDKEFQVISVIKRDPDMNGTVELTEDVTRKDKPDIKVNETNITGTNKLSGSFTLAKKSKEMYTIVYIVEPVEL